VGSFVYAPQVRVYVEAGGNYYRKDTRPRTYDVSEDLVSGTLTRRVDGVSDFSFTLLNPRRKYDSIFTPNDRITVLMKRVTWVRVFTESLAVELRGTGVTATALCPGFVHTEFHERGAIDTAAYPEIAWLNAEDVVATGLADVRRGAVISTPSLRYRTLSAAARLAPRSAVRAFGRYRRALQDQDAEVVAAE